MPHVSEIHEAGGLDKWIRKQAGNAKITHDVQRRATKVDKAIDSVGKVKTVARNQKMECMQ